MRGEVKKLGKNTYRVRFSLPRDPVTGKRARPTKTIHGTKTDAEKYLREWIRNYEMGQWTPTKPVTLNEHIEEWLGAAKEEMGDTTFAAYSYDLERFVQDSLGRVQVDKIRPLDVQQLFLHLVHKKGFGPSSVRRMKAALSKAFEQALFWRRVTSNPVIGCKVPGKPKARPALAMNPAQAIAFLDAAAYTPHLAMFELALASGMRPQEYHALSWPCIEWEAGRVRVERAIVRPRKQPARIGPVKTKASKRSIPVPSRVMDSLREHRGNQAFERDRLGNKWKGNEEDLVFTDSKGRMWDDVYFRNHIFSPIEEAAGLSGFTPYSLRHTCATLLLLGGEHPKVVAERLGHSSITRTMDTYSHVLPTMQESASDKLGQMLFQEFFSETIGDQMGIKGVLVTSKEGPESP